MTGFKVGSIDVQVTPKDMMVDSGTTFTHMPTEDADRVLKALSEYCAIHTSLCGRLNKPKFDTESCLELKQPDDNYKNAESLLSSFPNIEIRIANSNRPYILYPKNYFYKEVPDNGSAEPGLERLCISLKGEEEGKIILGAFAMQDYYFYFDRLNKELKIYKENCFLRSNEILLKRERILEETESLRSPKKFLVLLGGSALVGLLFAIQRKRSRK